MRVLLLVANAKGHVGSHAHRLAAIAAEELQGLHHEVRTVSIADIGLGDCAGPDDYKESNSGYYDYLSCLRPGNVSKSIQEQVDNYVWATHIVVFAPLWWSRLPAAFYAYVEKVNSAAFIANPAGPGLYDKGPFPGKKAMIVLTAGNILPTFTNPTGCTSIDGLMFETLWGSFYAVGIQPLRTHLICGFMIHEAGHGDQAVFDSFRQEIRGLETREAVPIVYKGDPFTHDDDFIAACRLEPLRPFQLS